MTTRKASDVLDKLISAVTGSSLTHPADGKPVAQAALCKDLMELLPEKKTLPKQGSFDRKGWQKYDTDSGYNKAIDQMEQAIKAYFGQGDV